MSFAVRPRDSSSPAETVPPRFSSSFDLAPGWSSIRPLGSSGSSLPGEELGIDRSSPSSAVEVEQAGLVRRRGSVVVVRRRGTASSRGTGTGSVVVTSSAGAAFLNFSVLARALMSSDDVVGGEGPLSSDVGDETASSSASLSAGMPCCADATWTASVPVFALLR